MRWYILRIKLNEWIRSDKADTPITSLSRLQTEGKTFINVLSRWSQGYRFSWRKSGMKITGIMVCVLCPFLYPWQQTWLSKAANPLKINMKFHYVYVISFLIHIWLNLTFVAGICKKSSENSIILQNCRMIHQTSL